MKRALAAAVAAILSGASPALSAEIALKYVEKPLGNADARRMWADLAPEAKSLGEYSPWVLVATHDLGNGSVLTISQLWAGGICGARGCPLRVFVGTEQIADVEACDNPDDHAISDDGRVIRACDAIIRTNRR